MDQPIDFRIVKVLATVEANPSESLPNLARLVNLSHSRLGHLFKIETGMSLTSFIDQQRMEKAATLLRSTELRIKEITYSLGYSHETSFARAFQKKFGCTPTDYRKQQRQSFRSAPS